MISKQKEKETKYKNPAIMEIFFFYLERKAISMHTQTDRHLRLGFRVKLGEREKRMMGIFIEFFILYRSRQTSLRR